MNAFTNHPYKIRLLPGLLVKPSIIIPISMSRYSSDNPKKVEQYDREIHALLQFTANHLQNGQIKRVDVVSAAELQALDWGEEKAKRAEEHFLNIHQDLLQRQSGVYTWSQLVAELGQSVFQACYLSVKEASREGMEWYELMIKSWKSVRMCGSLEKSLEYQRREYATILAMHGRYSNLLYIGNLSLAWAYLYKYFRDRDLPIFTRVIVEKPSLRREIGIGEAQYAVQLVIRNIEDMLTNPNFPPQEKQRLIDLGMTLFYTYSPKIIEDSGEIHLHENTYEK